MLSQYICWNAARLFGHVYKPLSARSDMCSVFPACLWDASAHPSLTLELLGLFPVAWGTALPVPSSYTVCRQRVLWIPKMSPFCSSSCRLWTELLAGKYFLQAPWTHHSSSSWSEAVLRNQMLLLHLDQWLTWFLLGTFWSLIVGGSEVWTSGLPRSFPEVHWKVLLAMQPTMMPLLHFHTHRHPELY